MLILLCTMSFLGVLVGDSFPLPCYSERTEGDNWLQVGEGVFSMYKSSAYHVTITEEFHGTEGEKSPFRPIF